jgi:hypothetical protein
MSYPPATLLVVVDTLRYSEILHCQDLLSHDHRFYCNHWGVSPFTLPAMASIVSGLLPEHHGLWYDWQNLYSARTHATINSTIANDYGGHARAVTGRGFADGPKWRYSVGFEEWHYIDQDEGFAGQLVPHDGVPFLFLHSYLLHDYVFDNSGEIIVHNLLTANELHPVDQMKFRLRRLGLIEHYLLDIIRRFGSNYRIIITSDHGEGITPYIAQGHGPGSQPYEDLLHLPLVVFGDEPGIDPMFIGQHHLRKFIVGEPIPQEDVEVQWPWSRENEPMMRSYVVGPTGLHSIHQEHLE